MPNSLTILLLAFLLITSFHIDLVDSKYVLESKTRNSDQIAPLLYAGNPWAIPNHYIVHLRDPRPNPSDSSSDQNFLADLTILQSHTEWLIKTLSTTNSKSRILHTYKMRGFIGYSGVFESSLLNEIRLDESVDFVEADQLMWASDTEIVLEDPSKYISNQLNENPPIPESPIEVTINKLKKFFDDIKENLLQSKRPIFHKKFPNMPEKIYNCSRQMDAPWGLSRVSAPKIASGTMNSRFYLYPNSAGTGVDAYIIDTGININHAEFEGRAKWGVTIPDFDLDLDGNGHGTHSAGIVGGKTYGVAKKVNLIAVKVLRTNGIGTNADVIKGVEWVVNQHRSSTLRGRRSVVNMSLGGNKSIALERAIDASSLQGVHFAVAAGNDNADACKYSPAGSKCAITVGASTIKNGLAYFSNNGPCVDIIAPGVDIQSAWIGTKSAIRTISGTSMAAPHMAGVIALYLGERDYRPSALKSIILQSALENSLAQLPENTPNRLLNTHALLRSIGHQSTESLYSLHRY